MLCEPLPLKNIRKFAVTKFVGITSSFHINCIRLNSSSLIIRHDLYTSAGTPSGPVAFPGFSFLTARSYSFLEIGSGSNVFGSFSRLGRRDSAFVAWNFLIRKFFQVVATSSGGLQKVPVFIRGKIAWWLFWFVSNGVDQFVNPSHIDCLVCSFHLFYP